VFAIKSFIFLQKNDSKGFFTVSGPHLLRPGEIYTAYVFCSGYEKDEKIQVGIVAGEDSKKEYENSKTIVLNGSNTQKIDFDVSWEDFIFKKCKFYYK
jgi:hypothetical protein